MRTSDHQHQRIIRPDSRTNESTVAALRHLTREIWLFRGHIKTVFRQDFRGSYHGTGLGVLWNFILPLVPLTVYMLLGILQVVPDFEGVNGTTYRAYSVTLWFLLAGCVQLPIQTVQSRNREVMKTAFPLSAAIVSSFGKLLFDTAVRSALVVIIVIATGNWPVWSTLLLPVAMLPALMLFTGTGLLLGLLNTAFKDVSRVTSILLTYGIFLSGVIFPLPHHTLVSIFSMVNPFAVFIDAGRGIVFKGGIANPVSFAAMSLLGILVFLLACRQFYHMELRVRGIA